MKKEKKKVIGEVAFAEKVIVAVPKRPVHSRWQRFLYAGTVPRKEIMHFTKNLLTMLHGGSTILEAVDVLREQARGKLRIILDDVHAGMNAGAKLSTELEKYPTTFNETYTNMLRIGEESGRLEENLKYIAEQLEKSVSLKRKVIGAMVYPAVVLVGGIGLSFGITVFVLPKVTRLFRNFHVQLPWTTRTLIAVSEFFQGYGIVAYLGVALLIILFFWLVRRKFLRPITHWIILHTPIVRQVSRHMNVAIFCRTVGTLLKSGVTIDESVRICERTVANVYYKKALRTAYEDVKAGDTLTGTLKKSPALFPPTDLQLIGVAEASGTLGDSLTYCSEVHDEEVDSLTKNLSTILEPLLLIAIGILVGFIALSIITPIYSITGSFRS